MPNNSHFFTTFAPTMKPIILISNDDGYQAQGIKVLADMVCDLGQIIVVAPDSARSGAACAISSTKAVTVQRIEDAHRHGYPEGVEVYSTSGTPVDCVKIALEKIVPCKPQLMLSGINHGDNASVSLFYSGTVGAAMEACMKAVPAVAFSLRTHSRQCDFMPYRDVIRHWAEKILHEGLPDNTLINVNFPEVPVLKGTSICRMARGTWHSEWIEQPSIPNPQHSTQYTLTGTFVNLEPEATDTDYWALDHDMAAVCPLKLDLTDYALLSNCR